MSKAMEQLSPGRRINSSGDDAAGLAIVSSMTAQVKGLNQAVRNVNDGISLLQVADGAYAEVENMMQRMRELAIQAASETYTDTERVFADSEFVALRNQIASVGSNTTFNGDALLDGEFAGDGTLLIHSGSQASQTQSISLTEISGSGTKVVTATAVDGTAGPTAATATYAATGLAASATVSASVTIGSTNFNIEFTTDGTGAISAITNVNGATATFTLASNDTNLGDLTFSVSGTNIVATSSNTGATVLMAGKAGAITYVDASATTSIINPLVGQDLTSQSNANTAIGQIDTALSRVQTARAGVGAAMNSLTYTVDVLSAESANMSAARSRIQDADYATATTELARTQIIQQAGTAMLAQANQLPQTVLSLLQ
jgi:flagellin